MAHLPGLSVEEEQDVMAINEEINKIDLAIASISRALTYFDGELVSIPKADLEVVMKSALKYQKELLNKKNEYQKIIDDNTPAPSFK